MLTLPEMGTPCSFFTGTCQIHHLVHQDFTNTNFGTFIEQSFDNIKLPFCERSIIRFIWNWFFERFLYKLFCPIFLSNTFIGDLKGSFGNFNALCSFFHGKQHIRIQWLVKMIQICVWLTIDCGVIYYGHSNEKNILFFFQCLFNASWPWPIKVKAIKL